MLINFNGSCQGTPGTPGPAPPPTSMTDTHKQKCINIHKSLLHICKNILPLCIITIDVKWITVGAGRFGTLSMCIVRCHPISFAAFGWMLSESIALCRIHHQTRARIFPLAATCLCHKHHYLFHGGSSSFTSRDISLDFIFNYQMPIQHNKHLTCCLKEQAAPH